MASIHYWITPEAEQALVANRIPAEQILMPHFKDIHKSAAEFAGDVPKCLNDMFNGAASGKRMLPDGSQIIIVSETVPDGGDLIDTSILMAAEAERFMPDKTHARRRMIRFGTEWL